jgi:hypothetical protein
VAHQRERTGKAVSHCEAYFNIVIARPKAVAILWLVGCQRKIASLRSQ